ncbi:hypothetical protein GCM10009839_37430 [Catenulispora yoronensis]|uniref:Hydrophobin n=1 Tax=Catenulispora yoronensis TaxID=450799 RepID=A0ABP5FV61_9ACTN
MAGGFGGVLSGVSWRMRTGGCALSGAYCQCVQSGGGGAGPDLAPAQVGPDTGFVGGQLTFSAVSSITKDVCKELSSVPVNFRLMVWPM